MNQIRLNRGHEIKPGTCTNVSPIAPGYNQYRPRPPRKWRLSPLNLDRDDVYYVLQVTENSPAPGQGIARGDKIIFINGKDVRDFGYKEFYALLKEEGRNVKATIEKIKRVSQNG